MSAQILPLGNRWRLLILVLLVTVCGLFFGPAPLEAANTYIEVTEEVYQEGFEERVKFAVNTDFDNIVAFAVSHPAALFGNAGVDDGLVPPEFAEPPEDWYGTTIEWDDSNSIWKEYVTDREINWLEESVLPTDEGAFLFTCYDGSPDDSYGDALFSPATTGGFYGITAFACSEFAAYDNKLDETLSGETSVVPLPSTLMLFGSGCIGLMGLRKKLKR